jgi:hypothetical protein
VRKLKFGPRGVAICGGLVNSLIAGLVFPYLSFYLTRQAGYTFTAAGTVIGIATGANILLRIFSGGLLDRVSPMKGAWFGLLLAAVLPVTLIWDLGWAGVLFGLIAYNLGGIFFDSAITLIIYSNVSTDAEKKINYSYYYAAHNAFMAVAPAATFLASPQDYRTLFSIALAAQAAIVCTAAFAVFSRDYSGVVEPRAKKDFSVRSLYRMGDSAFILVFAIGVAYSLIYRQYFTNIPILLGDSNILGHEVYPLIVAINGAFVVVFQSIYIRILKRLLKVDFLVLGSVCLLAGILTLLLPLSIALTIVPFAFLFTLAEVLLNLSIVDHLMTQSPKGDQARWLNWFALSRLSSSIAIPLGAKLLELHTPTAFILTMAMIAGLICVLATATAKVRRLRAWKVS